MAASLLYKEKDVLQQLAEGDPSAFKKIYDGYWYSIYKVTKQYTRSTALAEDIVQEVFSTLWDKRANFAEVLHLEYYLITMAKNLTYKALRRIAVEETARNEFNSRMPETDSAVDDLLLEKQYEQLLHQAVGMLPSQQKQIFYLAKVEGLSHKDIAEQLDISHLTVKAHMAKALQFIRHYLHPHVSAYAPFVVFLDIFMK